MTWLYKDKPLEDIPEDYIGFVYRIECLPTNQKYIGRKIFRSTLRKKVKNQTRRKKVVSDSGWKNYYGSSEYMKILLHTHGKENFKRTILYLCKSKSEMSYMETKEILVTDALIRDDYINRWLTAQINGKNLTNLKEELKTSEKCS